MNVESRAEQLYFDNTTSKADSMQCIPYYRNPSSNEITDFHLFVRLFGTLSPNADEFGENCYFIDIRNEVTFYRQVRRHKVGCINHASYTDFVNKQWIEPMLIFVNNRFVKWSNIFIYDDKRSTYLLLNLEDIITEEDEYTPKKLDILHLPFFVTYTENNVIHDDKQLIFTFNDTGLFDFGGHTRIYMNRTDRIWYHEGQSALGGVWRYDLDLPDECHVYPDNVIVFKNGLLYREAEVTIDNYNAMAIDEGDNVGVDIVSYKVFRDMTTTLEARNIDSIPNHDYLKHLEYNYRMIEMLEILNTEFDFQFDPNLTYDENMKKFTMFALKYNYRYFIDSTEYKNTKIVSYSITDLWSMINNEGCVTLPYPASFRSSCFPLIFIDGYMSNRFIKKYGKNDFVFNLSEVSSNSRLMEIVFFRSYWDRPCLPFSYDDCSIPSYFFSDVSEIGIFSKYHPDKCFEMDDESRCFYTVDRSKYTYEGNKLQFTDNDYAGQPLIIAPRHRVIYDKFIFKTNNYRLILGDRFNYANREELYTVFINGKKLNSALYRVIVPSPVRPFNNRSIYFLRMLKPGDVVEVLYSSMTLVDEVYIKDLNHSSEQGTGIDALGYINGPVDYPIPLSNRLQFFFINGRKVNPTHLKDLSFSLIRVTEDYNSIEDLCIINFENETYNYVESLKLSRSLLDQTYEYFDKSEINNLTNTYAYITEAELAEKADFSKEAIIHQIVKDYYVHVNKGVPFRYTFDKETYTEYDAEGNIILDVIDGTKYKSLEVKEIK